MRPLVLSLNPALDIEWRTDGIRWEEKNAIQSEVRWAGGKGVNVARWLRLLGSKPQLVLPLGGENGRELAASLRQERLPARVIRLREPTRANVVITDPSGRQMRFNRAGPRLHPGEWRKIQEIVRENISHAGLLILSGSLPRGVPVIAYARFIRQAHRLGVRTLLDCDGEAFAAAVWEHPFLVKPNEHELAQWRRCPLRTETEVVAAARALSEVTRGWVLVSRGAKSGLLIHAGERVCLRAIPPRLKPLNRLGAGDALLAEAARQIECGFPPEEWLRQGLAAGSAATQCGAGVACKPAVVTQFARKVRVAVLPCTVQAEGRDYSRPSR